MLHIVARDGRLQRGTSRSVVLHSPKSQCYVYLYLQQYAKATEGHGVLKARCTDVGSALVWDDQYVLTRTPYIDQSTADRLIQQHQSMAVATSGSLHTGSGA